MQILARVQPSNGSHHDVQVFAGPKDRTLARVGVLTMKPEEMVAFVHVLTQGSSDIVETHIEFAPEERYGDWSDYTNTEEGEPSEVQH